MTDNLLTIQAVNDFCADSDYHNYTEFDDYYDDICESLYSRLYHNGLITISAPDPDNDESEVVDEIILEWWESISDDRPLDTPLFDEYYGG